MKALDPSIATVRGFSADLAAFTTGDGLSGYIDRTGAISIPATFALARPFCTDRTAAVRMGSAWGLIDRHGSFVVRPDYEDIHCLSEGLAAAKSGKWGFDKAGTKQIDWLIYPLSYFVPTDPHYTSWTYIDRRGRVVASGGRD